MADKQPDENRGRAPMTPGSSPERPKNQPTPPPPRKPPGGGAGEGKAK
ncbi:hypothetical protein ACWF9G_23115 [Nocardia sp. NPDC055029]